MKLMLMIVAALSLPSVAGAYVSDEGHEYTQSCNTSGVILRSNHPVTRQVGYSAGAKYWKGIEVIYLGKNCDALNLIYGAGEWSWANGGFWVTFPGKEFAFGAQEIYCPGGGEPPTNGSTCRR